MFWCLRVVVEQLCSYVCCGAGVYAVLGRRRARVVREEMREGSDLFSIHAYLPAQASFGFANDMRRQSSGDKLLCTRLLCCCVAQHIIITGPIALLEGQPGDHSSSLCLTILST